MRSNIVTLALLRDTFREALARKIFWGLFGFSTVLILFFIFIMKIDIVEGALATVSLFGQEMRATDVNRLVRSVHSAVAAFLYSAGVFVFVFASAGLIPTVFEPGRIELLLSKPVPRWHILLGRYAGNLLVVAANMLYLVVSIWVIFGIKAEIWSGHFLSSLWMTVFVFCVLLTVVLLVAILWESAALATIVAYTVMIVSLLVAQRGLLERLLSSEWSRNVIRGIYWVLPKIWDCGDLGRRLVQGEPIENWTPVWSTALFGVVVLGASLFAFSRRNY